VDSYLSNMVAYDTMRTWPVDLFFRSSVTLLLFYFILKNMPLIHRVCVYILNLHLSDLKFHMIGM